MAIRSLEPAELRLMERLLSVQFPGQLAMLRQLNSSQVEKIDGNGSLRFIVDCPELAGVGRRVPVEAQCVDSDGVMIHALVHVVSGRLFELEIYRDDSAPIVTVPDVMAWNIQLLQ